MSVVAPLAGLSGFGDAIGDFFSSLAHIDFVALLLGMVLFLVYLTIRSRAYFHVLRAAFPEERFQWRRIWGAYVASYGFNNVVPARGGDVIKLFLVRSSIPGATYPTVGSSIFVEAIFDLTMAVPILLFAFTQGIFPKPPDFSKLQAFDLSFFATHPQLLLFTLTALAILSLVGFALLSRRVAAFWARVRQGIAILFDRRRWFREVWCVQFVAWLFRCAAFWALLVAFGIHGSVRNVALVLGVNVVAAVVPFTPGGAGVQQAFLVKIFGGGAAAYSVGQQIAIAIVSLSAGFLALVVIFQFRSFKAVIAAGRESRAADKAGAEAEAPIADPRAPRARE